MSHWLLGFLIIFLMLWLRWREFRWWATPNTTLANLSIGLRANRLITLIVSSAIWWTGAVWIAMASVTLLK